MMRSVCRRLAVVLLCCAGPMPLASADEAYCDEQGKIIEPKRPERAYVNCSRIFYVVERAR